MADSFLFSSDKIRPPTFSISTKSKAGFTTTDGVDLLADVFLPDGVEKAPTVLVRIPFSKTFSNKLRSQIIARHWAGRGYAVVIQGTRGRYESGGKFYPLIHERDDGIATLKWLTNQPWYDGRVVMWGGSSFGYTQWAIADQSELGLKALFVQIASTNFRGMFYPGNALSLESALYWAIRSRGEQDRDVRISDIDKGVTHLPIIESDDKAIGNTEFFDDWLMNRDNDDFWRKIDGVNRAESLKAPALLMGGWFDPFLPTQLEDFRSITTKAEKSVASETRLIIGPWGHAQSTKLPGSGMKVPYRVESVLPSIPWFDHQLGIVDAPLDMARVNIFVMGENRWRNENEWPLARTRYTCFYLGSDGNANTLRGDGSLSSEIRDVGSDFDKFVYDPLNPVPTAGGAMLSERAGIELQNGIEERSDVLVYSTRPLRKSMEVTGPVRVILYVSTDAQSTDFSAKLTDVHPDGSSYNLSDGILRRDFYQIKGKPVKIEIELWPTSNVFFKGHKIRLEISSSNFPRYDRNLNTGEFIPTATRFVIANQKIFHSPEYPSKLVLPVIPRENTNDTED
jgi:putative CocE/NonD family hydrolase